MFPEITKIKIRLQFLCSYFILNGCSSITNQSCLIFFTHPVDTSPCSSVRMRWGTDRHTDTQTAVANVHFASAAPHAKCNNVRCKFHLTFIVLSLQVSHLRVSAITFALVTVLSVSLLGTSAKLSTSVYVYFLNILQGTTPSISKKEIGKETTWYGLHVRSRNPICLIFNPSV